MQRTFPKKFRVPGAAGKGLPGRGVQKFGRGLLASSHAGTRLPIAANCIQGTGRSPSARRGTAAEVPLSSPFPKGTKNGRHRKRCLPKKVDDSTTSYGGIIRIRCKGRRCFLPLSPSSRAPPVFCCEPIIVPRPRPVNRFWGTESKNQSWPGTLGRRAKLSASSSSVGMVSVILPSWNFS